MKNDIKTVVVLPDIQAPFHDKRSLRAVLQYLETLYIDECVIIGDFADVFVLSHHSDGLPGVRENRRFEKEMEVCNLVLDQITKAVRKRNPKAKITLIEGNHEHRVCRYLEKFPELKGSLEIPIKLRLAERDIKWIPFYCNFKPYKIGKATFIHGLYTNEHHGKKHVLRYGSNVFYGHTHDVQAFSAEMLGKDQTIVGQSLGCLCRYDLDYVGHQPTKWQQAFGLFYFLPNGRFTYYVPRIFGHKFVDPGGKLWQG